MRKTTRTLFLVTVLAELTAGLAIFAIMRELAERGPEGGITVSTLGWIGGINALLLGVASVFSGRLSDRFGRARVMLIGQVVCIAALSGCLFFTYGHPLFLPSFWMIGTSLGMVYVPLIAWVSRDPDANELRGGVHRSLILFCISWNVGLIAASVLAGYLFQIDPRVPVALAIVAGLVNVGVMIYAVHRDRAQLAAPPPQHTPLSLQKQRLSSAYATLAWMANVSGAFAVSMVFYLLPALIVKLDYPSDEHGIMLGVMRFVVIGMYLALYFTRFWHHRFSAAAASQVVAIVGLLIIATADTRTELILGMCALAQLTSYNYFASLYYSTSSTDVTKGAASGMHEATIAVGFGAGAIIGGLFGRHVGPHMAGVLGELAVERAPYVLAAAAIAVNLLLQLAHFMHRVLPMCRRAMIDPTPDHPEPTTSA